MRELERPAWCPDKTCMCLGSYSEALCAGRLAEIQLHPGGELYNSHSLCEGPEDRWLINDADAYYHIRLMEVVRRDVADNGLYDPGRGQFYDFRGQGPGARGEQQ